MKNFNCLIILICTICSKNLVSSQSLEAAFAEFNSDELKPLSDRKVLQAPSPAYNKNDIIKMEENMHDEFAKQTNDWESPIERRMDLPISEIEENELIPSYRRSVANEWNLRRALRNERHKNDLRTSLFDKKHENLALRNADKMNEITQYTKAVDGKVDTLHADHETTRKLAKATRGGVKAIKLAMDKNKVDTDHRLNRYSGELKANGTRLSTIHEAVNENHQEAMDNMETLVTQMGKNVINEGETRNKIGQALEQHGKHLDKNRNKLKNMKARTKHLYESVEVQGGALDNLGTNFGNINDEMKALKSVVASQDAALRKLEFFDKNAIKKMAENQQILTKSVLESNKLVLELLGDFAHELDERVSNAIDSVNLGLAKALSIDGDLAAAKDQQIDEKLQTPKIAEQTSPSSPTEAQKSPPTVATEQQQQPRKIVPNFFDRVQHPLFLKKRDPKREQYEKEQQQQKQQTSATASKPTYEKLGRPYADEFSKPSTTASSTSNTTADGSKSTFENALKALGLKKNGKKLVMSTSGDQQQAPATAPPAMAATAPPAMAATAPPAMAATAPPATAPATVTAPASAT